MELFTRHHIFTREELASRYEIFLENYVKTVAIEAKTLREMLAKDFLPAVSRYASSVSGEALSMKTFVPDLSTDSARKLVSFLGASYETIAGALDLLDQEILALDEKTSLPEAADYCRKTILATMEELRSAADQAEAKIPEEELPYPTYDALLFSV